MVLRALLIFLSTTMCVCTAYAQPDSLWSRTYGGTSQEGARYVDQTPDGGYLLAGYTHSRAAHGELDGWLIKTDENGDSLWTRVFGGPENDIPQAAQATADGGYVIAGVTESSSAGDYDYWLVKTDADGDTQWTRSFGGPERDECYAVVQTSDGGYLMGGLTDSFGSEITDMWLLKVSAAGDSVWSRTLGGNNNDRCYAVLEAADGSYMAAGLTWSFGDGSSEFWLVAMNENGDSLWSRTYGGFGQQECNTMLQTADGGFALAGWAYPTSSHDFWLVRTDMNGDTLWTRRYGGTAHDECRFIQHTADGGFLLIGQAVSYGAGNRDIWLLKTDENGDSLWSRTFGGEDQDFGHYVRQTDDYGYVLCGHTYSFGAGSADLWILRTGPDPTPVPPLPFERVLPEDCTLLDSTWVQLAWTQSIDPNGDEVTYLIHVESPTYPFPDPSDFTTTDTTVWVEIPWPVDPLDDIHEFFWSVVATAEGDTVHALNGEGIFYVDIYEPPGPFMRLLPEDSTAIFEPTVVFAWSPSFDSNGEVTYLLHVESPTYELPDPLDFTTTDTTLSVEIPWPVDPLDDIHDFLWTVHAAEGSDTVEASNGEGIFFMDIPGDARETPDCLPAEYGLSVHPNPFNPSTTIGFSLPQSMHVSLAVYDPMGRIVKTLADVVLPAGRYARSFDAGDLPSGLYFARLQSGNHQQTERLILLR